MNDKYVKAQKAINSYIATGGNQTAAAEMLGIARSTFNGWLKWAFEMDLQEQKGFENFADKLIEMELRHKSQLRAMQRMLDQAQAKSQQAAEILGLETLEPQEYQLPIVSKSDGKRSIFFQLSDIHYGEVIEMPDVVYNPLIAADRLLLALAKFKLKAQTSTFDDIHLILGGDLFNGDLHEDAQFTNDGSVIELFPELLSLISFIVKELQEIAPVIVLNVSGNHGRLTKRSWNKSHHAMNWDYLFGKTLEVQSSAQFHVAENPDLIYNLFGKTLHITHGEKLTRSAKSLIPDLIRVANEDLLIVHHWHRPLYISNPAVIVGGAICEANEFIRYDVRGVEYAPGVNAWIFDAEKGVQEFETFSLDN